MEELLNKINTAVKEAEGCLAEDDGKKWRRKYRKRIKDAEKECSPPEMENPPQKKRGRIAGSKSRNLLERLEEYQCDVLRFMENLDAPYTNNQGERDSRMAKGQQKISGCFRSMQGAKIFCRIRSYLSACRKQGIGVGEALECLFAGSWPAFIQDKIDKFAE